MAFDPTLDEKEFSKTIEFEASNIVVAVYSYNEGEKKLQLTRERRKADDTTSFAKLGRMTKEEVEKVVPAIQEAIKVM